jgi:hypothetical protein
MKWLTDNIVVCLIGVVLTCLGWANHQQLDTIALKQDNAILSLKKEMGDEFVSKQWFTTEDGSLRAADAANAAAVSAVAISVTDLKTDIAVIKEKVSENKIN